MAIGDNPAAATAYAASSIKLVAGDMCASAASSAAAPKITGGANSGSTTTATSRPPRLAPSASAAPSPPIEAKATPPRRPVMTAIGANVAGPPSAMAAIGAAIATPDLSAKFTGFGVINVANSTPESMGTLMRAEYEKFGKVVKQSGAKLD